MRRILLVTAMLSGTVLVFAAAPTLAAILEIGNTRTPLAGPVCPATGSCPIILTETTALETLSNGVLYPTTALHDGRIVAFTVTPASVSAADINGTNATKTKPAQPGLNATYGGVSEVAITVLQPSTTSRKVFPGRRFWKVVGESPMFKLEPYFGHLVQFVLEHSLAISKGDVVALTVPTWAPLLSVNLAKSQFGWRASRSRGSCTSYTAQTAQLALGDNTQYQCFFNGTRVEYTATEITLPVPPAVTKPKKRHRTTHSRRAVHARHR